MKPVPTPWASKEGRALDGVGLPPLFQAQDQHYTWTSSLGVGQFLACLADRTLNPAMPKAVSAPYLLTIRKPNYLAHSVTY